MRSIAIITAAVSGFAVAALTGLAVGKPGHTLAVEKNVKDVRLANKLETVATWHGLPVYYLSGESKKHPLCTKAKGCFAIWIPVTVGSSKAKPSKAAGLSGKLRTWHRNGFVQVRLAGHPLYTFYRDSHGVANGDTITSFGGTWHLVLATAGTGGGGGTTGTTSTTTTTTCVPPYCP